VSVPVLDGKRLGRLPFDRTKPNVLLKRKTGATLNPPAQSDWGTELMNYMAKNDDLGCCTISDKAHVLTSQMWFGQSKQVIVPDPEVVRAYSAVSGYDPRSGRNDNGATLQDAFDWVRKNGFVVDGKNYRIESFAQIPTSARGEIDFALIDTCIDAFGHVATGMSFPDFAMDQFNAGQAWDLPKTKRFNIEGGHDVPIVGYGGSGVGKYYDVWTWGRRQRVTVAFLSRFMEEFWTQGEKDWQRADGTIPNGIDGVTANAEFQQLVNTAGPGWDGSIVVTPPPPIVVDPPVVDPPVVNPPVNDDAILWQQAQDWAHGKGLI
jgi:hypothetical protein